MKFRKKPVVIDAVQVQQRNVNELADFLGPASVGIRAVLGTGDIAAVDIRTLEGTMRADPGDWIIRGVKGELYPCKPDIFEATYERVAEPVPWTPPDADDPTWGRMT